MQADNRYVLRERHQVAPASLPISQSATSPRSSTPSAVMLCLLGGAVGLAAGRGASGMLIPESATAGRGPPQREVSRPTPGLIAAPRTKAPGPSAAVGISAR